MSNTTIKEFLLDIGPFFDGETLVYVDLGAHKGNVFAQVLASGLNIREAHLFEPNPESFTELKRNVEESKKDHNKCHVNSYNVAVGSGHYNVLMKKSDTMTKVVSIIKEGKSLTLYEDSKEFEVQCETLDNYLSRFLDTHISLLKVDVEGFEIEALDGGKILLGNQAVDVVYIEAGIHPDNEQQTYYRDIEDKLISFGYRLFKIYEQKNEWIEDSPFLRRVNLAFFSQTFAEKFSYNDVMKKSKDKLQEKSVKSNSSDKTDLESTVATKDDINRMQKRFESLCWLSRALNIKGRLPPLEGREMVPGALLELHGFIREFKPRKIVLLGSGASSLVIADALKQNSFGHLVAIDHHEGFADKSRELLEKEHLGAWAEVSHAPLTTLSSSFWEGVPQTDDAKTLKWYEASVLETIDNVDLLVIDGPPATTCRYARYPALPLLIEKLSPRSQIWVDDVANKEGKEMVHAWCQTYGLRIDSQISSHHLVQLKKDNV